MKQKRHLLRSPISLLMFFGALEKENAIREAKGMEPFQPLIEVESIIISPHFLLGVHNVIRQNLHLKPQVRYLTLSSIYDLTIAAAVGPANTFVSEGYMVLPIEGFGSEFETVTNLEISAHAVKDSHDRAKKRIAEAFSVTVEAIDDFIKEQDIFTFEDVLKMGIQEMGRPDLEAPVAQPAEGE